ncbi:hypothetical protein LIER_26482 [Lithospermum erythrorhizon]|uniref:DUF4283 domain-containing protein n=1 Tax=Lithospermum erythrorhizon TaxID=34254 RepID=A0AAV3RBK0_LITER
MDSRSIEKLPVWVRFLGLSLEHYDLKELGLIANTIGKPFYPDTPTMEMTRISYARVCVEINAEATLPKKVKLVDEMGKEVFQEVEYEWLPFKCRNCGLLGHKVGSCSAKKEFVPKVNIHGIVPPVVVPQGGQVGSVVDNQESLVLVSSPGPLREERGDIQVPLSTQEEAKGLGFAGEMTGLGSQSENMPLFSSKQSPTSVKVIEDKQRAREFPDHDVEVSCIDQNMFPEYVNVPVVTGTLMNVWLGGGAH